MPNIIYKGFTSAHSSLIYTLAAEKLNDGEHVLLIVPESTAVRAERRMAKLCLNISTLELEVLNFDRLADTVFRRCGSLCENFLSIGTKKLVLARALGELAPALDYFKANPYNAAEIDLLLGELDEIRHNGVSAGKLSAAARRIRDNESELSRKLDELALVYTAYTTLARDFGQDSIDILTRAAELISTYKPFKGSYVYFDGFTGFSHEEYEIIRALEKSGAMVYVSLALFENKSDKGELFALTSRCEEELTRLGNVSKTYIDPALGYKKKSLAKLALSYNIVTRTCAPCEDDGAVNVVSCSDMFDECEYIASEIAREIREGRRYGDIGIIVRDIDKYAPILELALKRQGIPAFVSDKSELCEKSLVRMILSAIYICTKNARVTDVISYMRSGLTSLDDFECDLLEDYAESWRISGKIWFSPDGFNMNARGYKELTSEDSERLIKINAARETLMRELEDLKDALSKCRRVKDYLCTVYGFLLSLNIKEKLASRSLEYEARGEKKLASEEASLFGAYMEASNEMFRTVGELECTCEEFTSLFSLVLANTSIGTIPESKDVVTLYDAKDFRENGLLSLYLAGCEEGKFPQSVQAPVKLTGKERKILAQNGLEKLEYDPAYESSRELFWFYSAFASAEEKLTFTYSRRAKSGEETRMSQALSRVIDTLSLTEKISNINALDSVFTKDGLICELAFADTRFKEAMLSQSSELKELYERASIPLSKRDERISPEYARVLHKGNIQLSQSITDTYVSCPFSYRCKYTLRLKEKHTEGVGLAEAGTLVHGILDEFVREGVLKYADENGNALRDKIRGKISEISAKRSALILAFTEESLRARTKRLLERITEITVHTAANITEELAQAGFKPTFFELAINEGTDSGVMPLRLKLEDGSYALLGGVADRVDTMLKSGKLYVRVVDYKSGKRSFSLDDIKLGLGLQLLIYLFTIWDNAGKIFKMSAGAPPDCEIIPAAAEYVMTNPDKPSIVNDSDVKTALARAFKRSGIYLADEEILSSLDSEMSGKYLPVSKNIKANGTSELKSLDELNDIKNEVCAILIDIAEGIKHGASDIAPLPSSPTRPNSACEYCPMKPVCKNVADK